MSLCSPKLRPSKQQREREWSFRANSRAGVRMSQGNPCPMEEAGVADERRARKWVHGKVGGGGPAAFLFLGLLGIYTWGKLKETQKQEQELKNSERKWGEIPTKSGGRPKVSDPAPLSLHPWPQLPWAHGEAQGQESVTITSRRLQFSARQWHCQRWTVNPTAESGPAAAQCLPRRQDCAP